MLEHNVSSPAPNCREHHYFKIGDYKNNKHLLNSCYVMGVVLKCLTFINSVCPHDNSQMGTIIWNYGGHQGTE